MSFCDTVDSACCFDMSIDSKPPWCAGTLMCENNKCVPHHSCSKIGDKCCIVPTSLEGAIGVCENNLKCDSKSTLCGVGDCLDYQYNACASHICKGNSCISTLDAAKMFLDITKTQPHQEGDLAGLCDGACGWWADQNSTPSRQNVSSCQLWKTIIEDQAGVPTVTSCVLQI